LHSCNVKTQICVTRLQCVNKTQWHGEGSGQYVCFVVRGVCEVTLSFLANVTGCRDSRSLSFCSSPQEKRNASPYITDPSCQPNFSHLDAIIRHNEFVINILEGAISGKTAVGRLRLQYFKQVVRNTGADNYTAMKRMACNNSRWKAANQSEY